MAVHDFKDNALLSPPVNNNVVEVPSNYQICQRSGFRVPTAEGLVQDGEDSGLWVRKEDYDPWHPQNSVRSLPETRKGSVSPEQPDNFLAASLTDPDAL